jgi:hypothetical protein
MSSVQNRREFLATTAAGVAARAWARAQSASLAGLPDVLRMNNGAKITRASDWNSKRRPEVEGCRTARGRLSGPEGIAVIARSPSGPCLDGP